MWLAGSKLGDSSSQANPSLLPTTSGENEGNPASLVYPRASTVSDRSLRVVQDLERDEQHWLSHGLHLSRCWRLRFAGLFLTEGGQETAEG